jgi:hypothetical protein
MKPTDFPKVKEMAERYNPVLVWLLQQRLAGSTEEGRPGRIGASYLATRRTIQWVPQ